MERTEPHPAISERLVATVCQRLADNKRVRRTLPSRGRVHIDRQLPFLCLYRRPVDREDAGTDRLVNSEASYVIASGAAEMHTSVSRLVQEAATTLSEGFGALLILEVWAGRNGGSGINPAAPKPRPTFRVFAPGSDAITKTVDVLVAVLRQIQVLKQGVAVEVVRTDEVHPPGLAPLLSVEQACRHNIWTVGIEVPSVYRHPKTGETFPTVLRLLRRSFALAIRRAFHRFAHTLTTHRPPHFHSLGRHAVVRAVWQVDEQLASVSNAFDYLLQLTPTNSGNAWMEFQASGYQQVPVFHYRPLPIDPGLLKRQLFNVPLERIEDPALHLLFQDCQEELERKITMLSDRDTPRFLPGSVQLFGNVDPDLHHLAADLLQRLAARRSSQKAGGHLLPEQFAQRANAEFAHYRRQHEDFKPHTVVTGDVTGMLVSRGRLLISRDMKIPASRVEALLAHEVGTHLVAYYNGRAQPFRQLYCGLAGYEESQEGVAVLAEFLMGGLDAVRMRHLAARVIAAKMVIEGASLVDVFRAMTLTHRFRRRSAFQIAARVFRGGGLTKDVVYLRGLRRILKYVQRGSDLKPLLIGKIAVDHLPIISELCFRNVLRSPPLRARYLEEAPAVQRLKDLRGTDLTVVDLLR